MQSQFRVHVRHEEGGTVIAVSGELDLASSPALEERLDEVFGSDAELVVLDLRELEFMDSTGLTLLTRWSREAGQDGYELALIRGEDRVHRLFEITGMAAYFAFVDG